MGNKKIYIFALAATGTGISGGDKIFIEFARTWSKHNNLYIHVWEEGFDMCERQQLKKANIKYEISKMVMWNKFGFFVNYLARIIRGIVLGCSINIKDSKNIVIYSASEFWMDSLPTFILKLRFPKIIWGAAWYQTAPKPWHGFSEGKRENKYFFKSLVYWIIQQPIKLLINNFADFVLVNNVLEEKQFRKLDKLKKTIVVGGGVDLDKINYYKKNNKNVKKVYDAVFQGRFHPQKGVLELIDIWEKVIKNKKDAKLIMIGDGPLMKSVKFKVKSKKLENNIKLTGYLFDGGEKYKIFSQSKLVVHPSFYDSGGMASAEAMAFGLPAVGFNLESYKFYYPKGMVKVPVGNLEKLAEEILDLLSNRSIYKRIAAEALEEIYKNWSWQKKAANVLSCMVK